ncbi:hypothetical protein RBU61_06885 [Tissierella sp. MB52-C2]|uniref:hypothetical protein n=1 Tax=Tissierella sp. MB52-C2 TaxID=3070999 RepID=UPI00280BBE72|nr:hypothetical protein [Tissierella sp. MB52-C2]WMM26391.1 hypothetical protein RBU61_06885 [Tissierella sp. MB52-C2]
MKRNKKILVSILCVVLCLSLLSACNKSILGEDNDIKELKAELSNMAIENAKKYFNENIDINEFDISVAEKVGDNKFKDIESIETTNEIYLIGHHKNKPENIFEFILVYNIENKNIMKFGIQTINNDDIVYANLEK